MRAVLLVLVLTGCAHRYGEATTLCPAGCGNACMGFPTEPCRDVECAVDYWWAMERRTPAFADHLIALKPQLSDGYVLHARLADDPATAELWYARAIHATHDPSAYQSYAFFLFDQGRGDDAQHNFAACAAIDPTYSVCADNYESLRARVR